MKNKIIVFVLILVSIYSIFYVFASDQFAVCVSEHQWYVGGQYLMNFKNCNIHDFSVLILIVCIFVYIFRKIESKIKNKYTATTQIQENSMWTKKRGSTHLSVTVLIILIILFGLVYLFRDSIAILHI